MEHQQTNLPTRDHEPFEIVHNARKNSKHIKSTAAKSRKNSTISLADDKQKKIKKKPRKLTEYFEGEGRWLDQEKQQSEINVDNEQNEFVQALFRFEGQNKSGEQKQKQQKEQMGLVQKQEQDFYFEDCEGEKGIMEGLGDENSLGRQFNFDFFNPEKYSR